MGKLYLYWELAILKIRQKWQRTFTNSRVEEHAPDKPEGLAGGHPRLLFRLLHEQVPRGVEALKRGPEKKSKLIPLKKNLKKN